MKKIGLEDGFEIPDEMPMYPPFREVDSQIYHKVLEDSVGIQHYFNKDGSYDGYSADPEICKMHLQIGNN